MDDEITEHDISLEPGTVFFDDDMIGALDLVYSTLPLETGKLFSVPALFPVEMKTGKLTISVREELLELETDGEKLEYFVCEVPELSEIHYVFGDGQLMKIFRPQDNVTIRLVEYEKPSEVAVNNN
ncbi:MAG: hypothetical protein HOC20_08095 [Chloroflexi bacterium]|jgi:hypothetical protein|nr:hypothetical protein [Chloroflexota bacterium]